MIAATWEHNSPKPAMQEQCPYKISPSPLTHIQALFGVLVNIVCPCRILALIKLFPLFILLT